MFGSELHHQIYITPSNNNGYLVTVGCCKMVYASKETLLEDLTRFLTNPKKIEELYYNRNMLTDPHITAAQEAFENRTERVCPENEQSDCDCSTEPTRI